MVLISVDLPQPFGPRMAACSPAWMRRVMSWRTVLSPRITVMLWKSSKALLVAGCWWLVRRSVASAGLRCIHREYTANMLKRTLIFSFVMSASLAFGQGDSNTVTVTASQSVNLQPDQVVFGVYVTTSINASLDDVLAALKGSGITIANLSGIGNGSGIPLGILPGNPQPTPTIQWSFVLGVPFAQMKATVTALTSLQQSIMQANSGFTLSFSVQGTQVSASLQQSQVCSIPGLIADATTQASKLASAARLNLGSIAAMSSAGSNPVYSSCALTVKFAVTRF